jgi:hypothetical protein
MFGEDCLIGMGYDTRWNNYRVIDSNETRTG